MTGRCQEHGWPDADRCPECELPHVVIPGSGVLTGSFKSVEEMYDFYGIERTNT